MVAIDEMIQALDKVTPGIASDETLLYGVEVKFYSNKVVVIRSLKRTCPAFRPWETERLLPEDFSSFGQWLVGGKMYPGKINRRLPEKETVVYSKEIEYNRRVGCRLCKKTGE